MMDGACRDIGKVPGYAVVPERHLQEARGVAWALRDYLQDADPEHPGLRFLLEKCEWLSDEAEYRHFCQGLDEALSKPTRAEAE